MSTDLRTFQNCLRILHSIDFHELVAARAIDDEFGEIEWNHFRANPCRYLMACDDDEAAKIWRVIEQRSVPMFKVTEALRIDDEAAP